MEESGSVAGYEPRRQLAHVSVRLMHKPRGTLGAFPPPLATELRFT